MRIALLHYTKPPVVGGVERVIDDQARALNALGHEVSIWNADESSGLHAGTPEAIIVHNVFTMPFNLRWTAELHGLAAAHPEIRWINWVHDVAAVNPHYAHLDWTAPEMILLRTPPPNASHVAVSEVRRQDYARATGLPPDPIHVIPNGVDPARVLGLTPLIARFAESLKLWNRDRWLLLHPARILRRKNIELGIAVTAELIKANRDVVYLVTGAPDPHQNEGLAYRAELQELITRLKLQGRVLFAGEELGNLSDDDVRSFYAIADALFFPSASEGFGLPLLEAVLHRLPVFCSDLKVHREVAGHSACCFNLEAPVNAIAAQVIETLSGPGAIARKTAIRTHSWPKICKESLEPLLRAGNESA